MYGSSRKPLRRTCALIDGHQKRGKEKTIPGWRVSKRVTGRKRPPRPSQPIIHTNQKKRKGHGGEAGRTGLLQGGGGFFAGKEGHTGRGKRNEGKKTIKRQGPSLDRLVHFEGRQEKGRTGNKLLPGLGNVIRVTFNEGGETSEEGP